MASRTNDQLFEDWQDQTQIAKKALERVKEAQSDFDDAMSELREIRGYSPVEDEIDVDLNPGYDLDDMEQTVRDCEKVYHEDLFPEAEDDEDLDEDDDDTGTTEGAPTH